MRNHLRTFFESFYGSLPAAPAFVTELATGAPTVGGPGGVSGQGALVMGIYALLLLIVVDWRVGRRVDNTLVTMLAVVKAAAADNKATLERNALNVDSVFTVINAVSARVKVIEEREKGCGAKFDGATSKEAELDGRVRTVEMRLGIAR